MVQVLVEAQLPVPPALPEERALPAWAQPVVALRLAERRALPVLVAPGVARLVGEPEGLLHRRSHQSFSAATARSSP